MDCRRCLHPVVDTLTCAPACAYPGGHWYAETVAEFIVRRAPQAGHPRVAPAQPWPVRDEPAEPHPPGNYKLRVGNQKRKRAAGR